MSLPQGKDEYISTYISSYKVKQGVLHNPKNDRRTTKGVFHIAEGGLPIPGDKKAVPINVAKYIFYRAFAENGDVMELPYTSCMDKPVKLLVSLLLRPTVCPEVKGVTDKKTMEIRFFAPGYLLYPVLKSTTFLSFSPLRNALRFPAQISTILSTVAGK